MQRKSCDIRDLFAGKVANVMLAIGVFWVSAALFLLQMTGGCSPRTTPSQRQIKPFEGLVVKVACPGEPATTVIQRYGQAWASESGARIEVVRFDRASGPDSGPLADIWVIPPAQMPHWAAAAKLHPVPEAYVDHNPNYAWENLLPLCRYKLLVWDRKAYAMPLLGDAMLCFYREDLFRDPLHREAFNKKYGRPLAAPSTWEEFEAIAEYFDHQPRPGIDRPCPSLPPLPVADEDLDREFYSVAVPFARRAVREDDPKPPPDVQLFSFHFDLESGSPRIDTPGFVHALRLLQQLQRYRPAAPVAEPPVSFEQGEAVMCLASPSWISRFRGSAQVGDKIGLCPVPGTGHVFEYATGREEEVPGGNRVPYLGAGGWVTVVPRTSENPEAAFALMAFLSDPRTSRDIVIEPAWGGGVFREKHLGRDVGWTSFGFDRSRTEVLVQSLRETLLPSQVNPVLRLRIPDERSHQHALVAELREALLQGKDAGQALSAAAARWRELDKDKDAKTRLRDYRLSLSLSGTD